MDYLSFFLFCFLKRYIYYFDYALKHLLCWKSKYRWPSRFSVELRISLPNFRFQSDFECCRSSIISPNTSSSVKIHTENFCLFIFSFLSLFKILATHQCNHPPDMLNVFIQSSVKFSTANYYPPFIPRSSGSIMATLCSPSKKRTDIRVEQSLLLGPCCVCIRVGLYVAQM